MSEEKPYNRAPTHCHFVEQKENRIARTKTVLQGKIKEVRDTLDTHPIQDGST